MIEKSFRTHLAGITSLKIYRVVLPQDVDTGIALRKASETDDQISNGSSSLQEIEFEVDVWQARYQDARREANAIKTALLGYVGPMTDDHCGGVTLSRDFEDRDTESKFFRVALAFRVFYRTT